MARFQNGVTSIVGGVLEIWKSVSIARETHERAYHLVTALDEFIIAEVCNYWEVVYPEEVQLREMFWNAEHTPEGRIILPDDIDKAKLYRGIGFLKQPESLGYRSARLLSIVDGNGVNVQ